MEAVLWTRGVARDVGEVVVVVPAESPDPLESEVVGTGKAC